MRHRVIREGERIRQEHPARSPATVALFVRAVGPAGVRPISNLRAS